MLSFKLFIQLYIYVVVFLLIWLFLGKIVIPVIILIITYMPYFRDKFRTIGLVIPLESVLMGIMNSSDKILLVFVLLFIPVEQLYLIYCFIRSYLQPVIFFIPVRKMLLESIIIVELVESKLFPLMDSIGDTLLKTVPFLDKLYAVFTDLGGFTQVYIKSLVETAEKLVTEFSNGSSIKEIMKGGDDNSTYNEDSLKEAMKYEFNKNYSTEDNQILENSLKECVNAGFKKLNSDTEPLDKLKIMLSNNGTSLGCNIKLFQKIESMKQSASSTTTST